MTRRREINIQDIFTDTFSHIGVKIMENLDHQSFLNCKLVNTSWLNFISAECQRSSSILIEEINFHKDNFYTEARKSLDKKKIEKAATLLMKLTSLQWSCKCLDDFKTVGWIARNFLPLAKRDLYISLKCLKVFLANDHEILFEYRVDKCPMLYQCEYEWIQYAAAKCDNFEMFELFAKHSGTFNPKPFGETEWTALHDVDREISDRMKKYILNHLDDPNPVGEGGHTALHMAAYRKNFELFMMIATRIGGKINVRDDAGKTPYDILKYKIIEDKSNHALLKYVVDHSENPNPIDEFGLTPLHVAAICGSLNAFRIIAAKVPNAKELFFYEPNLLTPLWWALVDDDLDSILKTLKEVNDGGHFWIKLHNRTIFDEIVEENRVELLKEIQSIGIDIRPTSSKLSEALDKMSREGKIELYNALSNWSFCQQEGTFS